MKQGKDKNQDKNQVTKERGKKLLAVVILLIMTLSSLFSRDLEFCPDKRLALTGIYTLLFASFF